MRGFCFVLIWIFSISVVPEPTSRPIFGVRISIGSNSQINTYVCYLENSRVLCKKRILDQASFIKIVSGYWPSIYNPNRINYFEENNIDCGITMGEDEKPITYCPPIDSLWKVRFATFPFQHNSELGWSNKYNKPSPKQERYLYQRYNVGYIDSDFFLDTNMYLLLNDVIDPNWIRNYKALY